MNPRILAATAAIALPLIALACDGLVGLTGPAIGDGGVFFPPPPTCDPDASGTYDAGVAPFLDDVSNLMCQRMVRCGMIDSTQVPDCVTTVKYGVGSRGAELESAGRAGAVTTDPCFASACLDAIGSAGCDPTTSILLAGEPPDANPYQWLPPSMGVVPGTQQNLLLLMSAFSGGACGKAFVGHLPAGSACYDPVECASGTSCVPSMPYSAGPGTCSPLVAIGDTCDAGTACPTSCGGPAPPVCDDAGSCDDDAGYFPIPSYDCVDGLPCVCAPALGEGQTCFVALVGVVGPSLCAEGLFCDTASTWPGVCRRLGSLDAGAACTPGLDFECAAGLYCDPSAMQCSPRLPAGATCAAEFACQDGLWCVGFTNGLTGVCAAPLFNGSCDATKLKAYPLPGTDGCLAISQQCVQGRCNSLPSTGPCDVYCLSGPCVNGACTADAVVDAAVGGDAPSDAPVLATLSGSTIPSQTSVAVDIQQGTTQYSGGSFFVSVPIGAPFQLTAIAHGYWPMSLQEIFVTAPTASLLQPITLISDVTAPGYDPSLGVLGISVLSLGKCADPTGATLAITGAASPEGSSYKIVYFSGGTPSSAQSVTGTALPSAYAYNLPVGVDLSVAISHPTCTQAPYPVAVPGYRNVTYTGKVRVAAGNATSYALVFLQ
jgi:hypothetical protein